MIGLSLGAMSHGFVDLPDRAITLNTFLRTLELKTGETYRATRAMGNKVVLVSNRDIPPADLRKLLARATWGAWVRDKNSWVIEEDRVGLRTWSQERTAHRARSIAAILKTLSKNDAPFSAERARSLSSALQTYDQQQKATQSRLDSWNKIERQAPAVLGLKAVVASMNPQELAEVEDTAIVYSNKPTRLQRRLPKEAIAAIGDFELCQNVWASIAPAKESPVPGKVYRATDPRLYADQVSVGSIRLVLKVVSVGTGGLQVTGTFVDTKRRTVGWSQVSLPIAEAKSLPEDVSANLSEPQIVISSDSIDHARSMNGTTPTADMRQTILAPQKREPLDFVVGDVVRGIADVRKKPVVAWIPDNLFSLETLAAKGDSAANLRPSEWIRIIQKMEVEVIDGTDSIILRPSPRAYNTDRIALAKLLTATEEHGCTPLEELSEYAAKSNTSHMDILCKNCVNALYMGASELLQSPWSTISLWGNFSKSQQATLTSGGLLQWTALTMSQRDRVVEEVIKGGAIEQDGLPISLSFSLDGEPTEALADITSLLPIQGIQAGFDGILLRQEGGVSFADVATLAQKAYQNETSGNNTSTEFLTNLVPGRLRDFGVKVRLTRDTFWTSKGRLGEFDLRKQATPLSALPERLRSRYDDVLARLRKEPPTGP